MRAFRHLYIATIREFVRDRTAILWHLVSPVLFMVIFGVVYGGEDTITLEIGLVNQDGAACADLVTGFEQIEAFTVTRGDLAAELAALEDGERDAVIVIPAGTGASLAAYFAALVESGAIRPSLSRDLSASLEVYTDPAEQRTSQIVLSVIEKVVAGISEEMTGIPPALTIAARAATRDDLSYLDFLLPGVLAMSLMQLGLYGTAEPLVSLREKHVLRRMGATPLTRVTLLASQIAFRLTLAVVSCALVIAVGVIVFGIQIAWANLPGMVGITLLGGTVFITMGYFLTTLARTEQAIQGVLILPYFLLMFLSGIFFPLESMPGWIRPFVDVLPLTYLGDALRATVLDAGSTFSMTRNIGILVAWLAVCAGLALRFFKWEPQA
jgi:ABC-2 type transport system permease protein